VTQSPARYGRHKTLSAAAVALSAPIVLVGLFVLNGTVLCDGSTARSGTVQSSVVGARDRPEQLRIMALNIGAVLTVFGRGREGAGSR